MTNMLEETEDISISALISDTNQISYLYSIFKDSLSIEAIFFFIKKEKCSTTTHFSIIFLMELYAIVQLYLLPL